jgi:serine phosphatase RsbU (regulator of sigma subunit)
MHEGFATCLAVRLEEDGWLTVANAGHLAPCINGIELPFAGTMPLGMIDTVAYEQTSTELQFGEVVILLTDGVAEAQNPQGKLLGFSAVESLLREGANARAIADAAQRHGQTDDITVIAIARKA